MMAAVIAFLLVAPVGLDSLVLGDYCGSLNHPMNPKARISTFEDWADCTTSSQYLCHYLVLGLKKLSNFLTLKIPQNVLTCKIQN
jgi:hypothetical protein